jgi:hypothetical protein
MCSKDNVLGASALFEWGAALRRTAEKCGLVKAVAAHHRAPLPLENDYFGMLHTIRVSEWLKPATRDGLVDVTGAVQHAEAPHWRRRAGERRAAVALAVREHGYAVFQPSNRPTIPKFPVVATDSSVPAVVEDGDAEAGAE